MRSLWAVGLCGILVGCGASPQELVGGVPVMQGEVTRADVEAELPRWVEERTAAQVDADASRALLTVPPGASLTVYFGSWCGDSRRELSRFWKALDTAAGEPPFSVRYVAVDRQKRAPDGLADGAHLLYVPTFVVERDGEEVGRIIESAPRGVEVELGALLRGEAHGVITGRTDL